MKRKSLSTLIVLCVLANLGCAARHGADLVTPDLVAQSRDAFVCESVARQQEFVGSAVKMGLSREDALTLYELSGAESKDVVTGFDPAKDRIPTVERAVERIAENGKDRAFYVEVDIRNLGGLNQALGHTGADEVYRGMSGIAESRIVALKSDSCSFRHGGDEFSFVVVGPGATREAIERALTEADQEIQKYVTEKGLAGIKHPKHPDDPSKSGAGILFGVSRVGGQDGVKDIFSAADKVVEKKKLE